MGLNAVIELLGVIHAEAGMRLHFDGPGMPTIVPRTTQGPMEGKDYLMGRDNKRLVSLDGSPPIDVTKVLTENRRTNPMFDYLLNEMACEESAFVWGDQTWSKYNLTSVCVQYE